MIAFPIHGLYLIDSGQKGNKGRLTCNTRIVYQREIEERDEIEMKRKRGVLKKKDREREREKKTERKTERRKERHRKGEKGRKRMTRERISMVVSTRKRKREREREREREI